jgi:two-component system sensor histidine kinase/response regulator
LGRGSTFWGTVRLQRGKRSVMVASLGTQAHADQLLMQRTPGMYALLAEDNPINQEVARGLLEAIGLSVDVAENGEQALHMAAERRYEVILMDMQMPIMDGLEATRAIRQLPDRQNCDDSQRCLEAGMNDHMAKPVNPDELYAMLLRWLPEQTATAKNPSVTTVQPAPVTPIDGTRLARLRAIPGLDPARGLHAVRGRESTYYGLLATFADTHIDDMTRVRGALTTGNTTDAQRIAHSLKGVAATLGYTDIENDARALESAINNKQESEVLNKLIDQLESLLLATGTALVVSLPAKEKSAPSTPAEIDWPAARKALETLASYLADDDPRALQHLEQFRATIEPALGKYWSVLRQKITDFELAGALESLREAQADIENLKGN